MNCIMVDFDITIEEFIGPNDRKYEKPAKKSIPKRDDRFKDCRNEEEVREKLIREATPYEKMFREILDWKKINYTFQKILKTPRCTYYVDFFINRGGGRKSLIIEIDGDVHNSIENMARDRERDKLLGKKYRIVRLSNEDVKIHYEYMKDKGLL